MRGRDDEQKRKMKILAIEDEETMIKLYRTLLEEDGHAVEIAETGEAAMERIEDSRFDLVILDLKLPDIEGMELFKKIKKKIEDLPFVVVTANPSLETSVEAIRTGGVFEYIAKPCSPDEIKKTVRRAIEKAELTYENKRLVKKLEIINQALSERVDQLEKFARTAFEYEKRIEELKIYIRELEARLKMDKTK